MSDSNMTIETRHLKGIVFMAMLIMNIDQINAQRLVDQILPLPPMDKYRHIKMVTLEDLVAILKDLLKQMMDLGFQFHVSLVKDFLAALYLVDSSTPCCPHCGYLPIENQDRIWKISEICVNPRCPRHIEKVGLVGPKKNPRRIVSVISNSRNDLPYLSIVQAAVQPLIHRGEVASFWDNTQVERGVDVDLKWQEADTILLLMSPELLARLYNRHWYSS